MPPKFDPKDPAVAPLIALFESLGLSTPKAVEAAKAPKTAAALKEIIISQHLEGKRLDEKRAALIVSLAGVGAKLGQEEKAYAVRKVEEGKLERADQLAAAVKYLELHRNAIDDAEFDRECGVGVVVTPEEVKRLVLLYLSANASEIEGWQSFSATLMKLKATPELRWAPTLDVKNSTEAAFLEKFGPKVAVNPKDVKKTAGAPKVAPASTAEASSSTAVTTERSVFEEGFLGKLHKPGGNPQINPKLKEQHLKATGGEVWTRFPPEPNGFLHIGHSKAIFVNFGYAAHHGGRCYLRYDDTNPEAEEQQYFDSILAMVRWLGYEPWKITYSSDYFQKLYDLAVELIKRDKAYVCHCSAEQIFADRGGEERGPRRACEHRSRPIEESLAEFEGMRDGKYKPGEATLRMKQDLEDGNPMMWDIVAYRVLNAPHHRTGTTWRIYPTYDFTHCLCDSFENISHSLCTTEFILSRESYEWLCDALEVYKPRQSEYGRLNLQGTVMSKRKILKLVKEGHVNGWDDPRLYTLIALRRRGVPPGAIISFVSGLGVSTSPSNIQTARFEQAVRQYLENTAPRLMMVLKPLKVTLENVPEDRIIMIEKPLHPKVPELGTSVVPFTRTLYIDADDFRLEDSKDYFRLAPGKTVGLFQAPAPITCTKYRTDPTTGEVVELFCNLEESNSTSKKPKAFIQWVADHPASGSPVRIDETRVFHQLFKSDDPAATDDFIADLNASSLEVVKGALLEVGFWSLAKKAMVDARKESEARLKTAATAGSEPTKEASPNGAPHDGHNEPVASVAQLVGNECIRFQGLRVGYFAVDKDAKLGCLTEEDTAAPGARPGDVVILNRIVSLKEDSAKKAS
ncbi:putative glutamine-tRNA ligase [Calocera cornea HHB12733]|uniref:glutamine--tRNA ligase n=1 Tax=Calocera cornea HHB12733 TaxID=1353952 RepID=A0A165DQC3_9BASI|nr:putative glutamine-tRNA ligase [Calocera cornea HHB12733]